MKKISQGKYEVLTTKENAIGKFMQMQGICRGEISGDHPIEYTWLTILYRLRLQVCDLNSCSLLFTNFLSKIRVNLRQ